MLSNQRRDLSLPFGAELATNNDRYRHILEPIECMASGELQSGSCQCRPIRRKYLILGILARRDCTNCQVIIEAQSIWHEFAEMLAHNVL
jgi:hypothetical protein